MANLELSRAQRLDQKVVELFPDLPRKYAVTLIETGKVTVNGEIVEKAGYKLRGANEVVVDYDPKQLDEIADIDLEILYEDADCIVLHKPLGVLTHSKGAFNPEATVASFIRKRIKDFPGERAGIVHRLDRATSGVIICAKTPEALSWLQKQFAQRRVKKTYAAVVAGHMTETHAIIDMPIERNPKKPQTFRVGANGKPSITEYQVSHRGKTHDLLTLKPQTGRTHQLRVHLSNLGHTIVGDGLYNGEDADRLYLHAAELELTLPNRERKTFHVPVPDAFREKADA
ncbi:MAG: RluA family pseudouridine synthase [Candidatus Saccharimonadales bacterium]